MKIYHFPRNLVHTFLSAIILLGGTAQAQIAAPPMASDYGVLVMAHGGSDEWNASVSAAVRSLGMDYPVEIAFGMADAGSLEQAVRALEAAGVRHVGVVRLFVSGTSWYRRTRQILGVEEGAPEKAEAIRLAASRPERRMAMGFWQIDTGLSFHLSREGLADAEEMNGVVLSRLSALSKDPAHEVALLIAHGTEDDAENAAWLAEISQRAEAARQSLGLREIRAFTLREDWPDKKAESLASIRSYIEQATRDGLSAIVVPFRVQGFGPYAEALEGLSYRADQRGLLPHENVNAWIANQARQLKLEALRSRHQLSLSESQQAAD